MKILKYVFVFALPMLLVFLVSLYMEFFTSLYFDYQATDIIMHTLGGFVTAHLGYKLFRMLMKNQSIPKLPIWFYFMTVIFFTLFIGVLWEWYELIKDLILDTNFQSDTQDLLEDLSFDSLGAVIYLIFIYFLSANE